MGPTFGRLILSIVQWCYPTGNTDLSFNHSKVYAFGISGFDKDPKPTARLQRRVCEAGVEEGVKKVKPLIGRSRLVRIGLLRARDPGTLSSMILEGRYSANQTRQ